MTNDKQAEWARMILVDVFLVAILLYCGISLTKILVYGLLINVFSWSLVNILNDAIIASRR